MLMFTFSQIGSSAPGADLARPRPLTGSCFPQPLSNPVLSASRCSSPHHTASKRYIKSNIPRGCTASFLHPPLPDRMRRSVGDWSQPVCCRNTRGGITQSHVKMTGTDAVSTGIRVSVSAHLHVSLLRCYLEMKALFPG